MAGNELIRLDGGSISLSPEATSILSSLTAGASAIGAFLTLSAGAIGFIREQRLSAIRGTVDAGNHLGINEMSASGRFNASTGNAGLLLEYERLRQQARSIEVAEKALRTRHREISAYLEINRRSIVCDLRKMKLENANARIRYRDFTRMTRELEKIATTDPSDNVRVVGTEMLGAAVLAIPRFNISAREEVTASYIDTSLGIPDVIVTPRTRW